MESNMYQRIPLDKRILAAIRMINRFQVGETVAQISLETGISRTHLYTLEEKYNEEQTMMDKKRGGRPAKTDERTERRIVHEIRKEPFQSSLKLTKTINEGIEEEKKVTPRTVRRVAQKKGFLAYRPLVKPYLTPDHIRLRLEFAENYKEKTTRFWMNVIFMDEVFIRLARDDARKRVRRLKGERLAKSHILPRLKHEGKGVMFWGCVTWYGPGPLVTIEGSLKGDDYADILENYIPEVAANLMTNSPYIIEDNPKVHKTKEVLRIKEKLGLRSLKLPANSPDLNIIESLWALLKDRISRRRPTGLERLRECAIQEWSRISREEIRKYIKSMPLRIREIISKHGEHTKY